jgi:WhiB family transcriptional regulator, redox-sensing transcriptional regulator
MTTVYTRLTDVDGCFADPDTRDLLGSLFGEQGEDDWRDQALCAQTDPDLWFPEKGGSVQTPKATCARCPVRAECLAYALAHDVRFGVWGGLSERERRQLHRDRYRAAA